jgi:hypothetical protein
VALFDSASTKAVRRVLGETYPLGIIGVEEQRNKGVNSIYVAGVDSNLHDDAIEHWCIDMYARCQAVSTIPVQVTAEGWAGAGCMLNRDMEAVAETITRKFGKSAICLLEWPDSMGAAYGKTKVIMADPFDAALVMAMLATGKN